MTAPVAVILAAGKSTRMKSETPKVLHPVCGRLMIEYVLDAARDAGVKKIVVIVGHKADMVRDALSRHADVVFAEQVEQNGTGHAVMMAESELSGHDGSVLILAGDTPLLQGSSLKALLDLLGHLGGPIERRSLGWLRVRLRSCLGWDRHRPLLVEYAARSRPESLPCEPLRDRLRPCAATRLPARPSGVLARSCPCAEV